MAKTVVPGFLRGIWDELLVKYAVEPLVGKVFGKVEKDLGTDVERGAKVKANADSVRKLVSKLIMDLKLIVLPKRLSEGEREERDVMNAVYRIFIEWHTTPRPVKVVEVDKKKGTEKKTETSDVKSVREAFKEEEKEIEKFLRELDGYDDEQWEQITDLFHDDTTLESWATRAREILDELGDDIKNLPAKLDAMGIHDDDYYADGGPDETARANEKARVEALKRERKLDREAAKVRFKAERHHQDSVRRELRTEAWAERLAFIPNLIKETVRRIRG
ncbi:MAG: hypothetical protein AAB590_02335 [Patescibacteria group bacterium]